MSEMIAIADRVDVIPCATTLEAKVREVRQIASRQPHYNRRSRRAETPWWLQLRAKPNARLVAVRQADGHPVPDSWGPFPSRSAARAVADTLMGLAVARSASSCEANLAADELSTVVNGDLREVLARGWDRMRELASQELFEQAARLRDAMAKVSAASERHQRFQSLLGSGRIVAAEPDTRGGWAIAVIESGRLVAAAHARTGDNPRATARAAIATAESAVEGATGEETLLLARWLEGPLTRLVDIDRPLAWPIGSGSPLSSLSITALPGTDAGSSRPVGPAPGHRRVTRIAG